MKSRCITLRIIPYTDTRSVASVLTREAGRLSFMINDGRGREALRRRALMMPGGVYEALIDVRESRSIHSLRDVMAVKPLILDHPVKSTLLLFICDFVNAVLRDSQADTLLYDFVEATASDIVDSRRIDPNAVICFLIGFMQFMGIAPDVASYRPGMIFDMSGGVFRSTPPLNGRFLDRDESAAAASILRMNRRNSRLFKLSREQRRQVMQTLIEYYNTHFGSVGNLKSLDVLKAIFD